MIENAVFKKINRKAQIKRFLASWRLYVCVLPAVVYLFLFNYMPMYGVQIAFKDYKVRKGLWGSEWIGVSNFIKFFESYQFERVLTNTLFLSLYSIVAGFPIPIFLFFIVFPLDCFPLRGSDALSVSARNDTSCGNEQAFCRHRA